MTLPKGGVITPTESEITISTPKNNGSIPSNLIMGTITGVKMRTDSITDMKHPTMRKKNVMMINITVVLVETWN